MSDANALVKGIRVEFMRSLLTAPTSVVGPLISEVKSITDKEIYWYPKFTSSIKEWKDDPRYRNLTDFKFEVINKQYQDGIKILKTELSNIEGNIGKPSIQMQIQDIANGWSTFKDAVVNDMLVLGTAGLAYDGSYYFAATRPNLQGDSAINNIVSGGGVTAALIEVDLGKAIDALKGFKDVNGKPFNIAPNIVAFVPTHLSRIFNAISMNERDVAGTNTNTLRGTFTVVENFYQASSNNDWYMFNTSRVFKPFMYQDREAPKWEYEDGVRLGTIKDKFAYFQTTAQGAVAYGEPTSAVMVNN